MTHDEVVKIESDTGKKQQWGLGKFFRREGKKDVAEPKWILGAVASVFVISSVASLLRVEVDVRPDAHHGIDLAVDVGHEATVNVPPMLAIHRQDNVSNRLSISTNGPARTPTRKGLQMVPRKDGSALPPGILARARLLSGASNGPIRAELVEPIKVNGDVRIAAGTVLFGVGQSTEERLFVQFNKAVFKDGSVIALDAQGCDVRDQIVGLKGSKVSQEAIRLGASAGLNFVGGMSEGFQDSEVQGGVSVKKPSARNAALNGAAQAALEQARDMMSSLKSATPIIEVPVGTDFYVMTTGSDL